VFRVLKEAELASFEHSKALSVYKSHSRLFITVKSASFIRWTSKESQQKENYPMTIPQIGLYL